MTALPLTADPTPYPDPHQDQAPADASARTARLRRLVNKLINHARLLVQDLRHPTTMLLCCVTITFGTKDFALIIARITRGLQLAAALKATLPAEQRAARPARAAPAERKPRARRPAPKNAVLLSLPTSKEIAERLRTHSIGEILVEICRDLGVDPSGFLWLELEGIIRENGGDFDGLAEEFASRTSAAIEAFVPPDAWETPPPPAPAPRLASTEPAGATFAETTGPP